MQTPVTIELASWPTRVRDSSRPLLVLRHEQWDDYGHRLLYRAWWLTEDDAIDLGRVKIYQHSRPQRPHLPLSSEGLTEDFVSLGQSLDYYQTLEELGIRRAVETALRDLRRFPVALPDDLLRRTLTRSPEARWLLDTATRPAHPKLDLELQLDGFGAPHRLQLAFGPGLRRVALVVGRNGVGKTRLLRAAGRLVGGLVGPGAALGAGVRRHQLHHNDFSAGVLTVAYSAFDPFVAPRLRLRLAESFAGVDYDYCGLMDHQGRVDVQAAVERTVKRLLYMPAHRRELWRWAVERAGRTRLDLPADVVPWEDRERFVDALHRAAAGHQVLAMALAGVVAESRPGKLLLLDEPETHLHPGLLSTWMRLLTQLLEHPRIDSHALVVSHSPIPIQEVPAPMVKVLTVEDGVPAFHDYPSVSFGSGLTDILEHAFQLDPLEVNYRQKLRELHEGGSRSAVEEAFPEGLSLPARLLLERLER